MHGPASEGIKSHLFTPRSREAVEELLPLHTSPLRVVCHVMSSGLDQSFKFGVANRHTKRIVTCVRKDGMHIQILVDAHQPYPKAAALEPRILTCRPKGTGKKLEPVWHLSHASIDHNLAKEEEECLDLLFWHLIWPATCPLPQLLSPRCRRRAAAIWKKNAEPTGPLLIFAIATGRPYLTRRCMGL